MQKSWGGFQGRVGEYVSGATLARVRGVRPNPSIFRQEFWNPSIFGNIQEELDILALYMPESR